MNSISDIIILLYLSFFLLFFNVLLIFLLISNLPALSNLLLNQFVWVLHLVFYSFRISLWYVVIRYNSLVSVFTFSFVVFDIPLLCFSKDICSVGLRLGFRFSSAFFSSAGLLHIVSELAHVLPSPELAFSSIWNEFLLFHSCGFTILLCITLIVSIILFFKSHFHISCSVLWAYYATLLFSALK